MTKKSDNINDEKLKSITSRPGKRYRLVFDIDETILTLFPIDLNNLTQLPGGIFLEAEMEDYYLLHALLEMFAWLIKRGDCEIAFFSKGLADRNNTIMNKIWKLLYHFYPELPEVPLEIQHRHDVTRVSSAEYHAFPLPPDIDKNDMDRTYAFVCLGASWEKKRLAECKNTILIDDDIKNICNSQNKQLLALEGFLGVYTLLPMFAELQHQHEIASFCQIYYITGVLNKAFNTCEETGGFLADALPEIKFVSMTEQRYGKEMLRYTIDRCYDEALQYCREGHAILQQINPGLAGVDEISTLSQQKKIIDTAILDKLLDYSAGYEEEMAKLNQIIDQHVIAYTMNGNKVELGHQMNAAEEKNSQDAAGPSVAVVQGSFFHQPQPLPPVAHFLLQEEHLDQASAVHEFEKLNFL